MFDINGGGTIDADELDSALKTVDIHLSTQEIHDVLQVIDEDGMALDWFLNVLILGHVNYNIEIITLFSASGNGEIDFEEFLTLMTSTEKFLENLRGSYSN